LRLPKGSVLPTTDMSAARRAVKSIGGTYMDTWLSAPGDAERPLPRSPPGPAYARLGSALGTASLLGYQPESRPSVIGPQEP
jgi:hypothetical protein